MAKQLPKGLREGRSSAVLLKLDLDDGEVDHATWWLELPIGDDWTAAFRMFSSRGALSIGEVRVFPGRPTPPREYAEWDQTASAVPIGGIGSALFREVKIGEALRIAHKLYARTAKHAPQPIVDALAERLDAAPRPRRRGRTSYDHHKLARIAISYQAAFERDPRRPNLAMRRSGDWEGYGESLLGNLISRARKEGYLTGTQQGRPSGVATPRAHDVIEAEKKRAEEEEQA